MSGCFGPQALRRSGGLRGEVAGIDTRIDGLEKRFDQLDRDVQTLADRMWRGDRDS